MSKDTNYQVICDKVENDEYDSHSVEGSGSFLSAFTNLFKSLVGIGVLALPTAFSQSGWLAGVILLPLCAAGMLFVSNQLMRVADERRSSAKNLVEFVKETIPPVYVKSVNISLFCFQIGICISYVIFFIKYIQKSFCRLGDGFYCDSKVVSVCVSLVLLVPLVFIRDMGKLKVVSLIGNVVTITSLAVVSINCLTTLKDQGQADAKEFNMSDIGNSIGVFIFTFEGIGVYFNIRNSMKQPTQFNKVLNSAITLGIIAYCLVGFLGYITFGSDVNDLILFNFSDDNIPIQIVQLAYCISLIFSYPIQIFPCLSVIDISIKKSLQKSSGNSLTHLLKNDTQIDSSASEINPQPSYSEKKFFLYTGITRLFIIFITFTIGVFFDKVSDFISLTGDVCGIYLCYAVPVIVIHYQNKLISMPTRLLNFFILIVSTAFGIYGLYCTIIKISEDFG